MSASRQAVAKAFGHLSARRRAAALILLALIAATLLFIWGNSLQSPEESRKLSDAAERFTRPVILALPVESWHTDGMIRYITRKLGHFIEYFLLGAQLRCLALVLAPALSLRALWLFVPAAAAAGIDEALQLTSGRGAALSDVALDAIGAAAGWLLVLALYAAFSGRRRRADA